jgi:CheY-like chemotaxis protein
MLDHVIAGVLAQIDAAEMQRSGHAVVDSARFALRKGTQHLIDMPEQKRVLWVDDSPGNNRHEVAALAKLQIEVVAVRSTAEAMARIKADASSGESFDLVLSDWSRPGDGDDAMLGLLRALRVAGESMPLVCYHGETDPSRRAVRAARALFEGCFGEAVAPAELMALVERALSGDG